MHDKEHAKTRNEYPQNHSKAVGRCLQNIGGGSHDRFIHTEKPGEMITVPRHRELTPGTARSIAKAAGWH